MSKTTFGTFDETYQHIDAPTIEDKGFSITYKKRKLHTFLVPEVMRDPNISHLSHINWTGTRKLDGTNIRFKWDGEQALWCGKTNKFNKDSCPDLEAYIDKHMLEERFEEVFGRDKQVLLFCEYMGPKVQTNELGLDHDELFLLDVQVGDVFLEKPALESVACAFGIRSVTEFYLTELGINQKTLQRWIYDVQDGEYKEWEGIVVEPVGQFRDRQGKRIIYKIKNRDYHINIKKEDK